MSGPIARTVVLMIRLEEGGLADAAAWALAVRGYGRRHAEAVERDATAALEWATLHRAIALIAHDELSRRRGALRLHRRADPEGD